MTRSIERRLLPAALLLFVVFGIARSVHAQARMAAEGPEDPVTVRLELARGERGLIAALILDVRRGWKLYARQAGDAGLPLAVEWRIPAGWTAGAERWPRPERQSVSGLDSWVYDGRVRVERELFPNAADSATVVVSVEWAACADVCVRGVSEAHAALEDSRQTAPSVNSGGGR